MQAIFNNKTIMVTGGTGSIGSEIVRQLLKFNVEKVIVYSIDEIEHYLMSQELRDNRIEFIMGDIKDYQHLGNVFSRYDIDYVYHAAALKHVVMCEQSPIEPVKTNIIGTQNIIDICLQKGIKKMLLISTDKAVYPTNVMGATKFIAERLVLNANRYARNDQQFSCVRFGNVANSRGSIIPVLTTNLLANKTFLITDRNVTRFAMQLNEAVNLVLQVTSMMTGGETFILKMNAFNLGDMVDSFKNIAKKLKIEFPGEEIIGLIPGEKLHEDLISHLEISKLYETDNMFIIYDEYAIHNSDHKKAVLKDYHSNCVELIPKKDLEKWILHDLNKKDVFKSIT
jgi:UDP-N-acetylglucosamine 4,6-dehydratase/5-epimerase